MPIFQKLDQVLKLVAETGDRVIVLLENHDPFVVMDLHSYQALLQTAAGKQKLTGLSESELLEHINAQIAEWREGQAHEADEYELSQFRVDRLDESGRGRPPGSQTMPRTKSQQADDTHVENLPVIETSDDNEYHLEPL